MNEVEITVTSRDRTGPGLDSARSGFSRLGSTVAKVAKVTAVGLGVAGVAAAKFGFDAVKAYEESAQVAAQTNAVIKSTGGVAKVTAGDVDRLSTILSKKAGIDDELIASGQNVLLTFTNIRNEVGKGNDIFTQATALALDMSVALGTDLQSANIQLGKALNDPIKGVTALQRVGVSFTAQQREQIKTMVESGDIMGAQKLILAELSREFEGSAEAQATASGKMSVAWGNFQEAIGEKLAPILTAFSTWLTDTGIPALEQFAAWIETVVVPALGELRAWVEEHVLPGLTKLWEWIVRNVIPVLSDLGNAIIDDVIPALGRWLEWLGRNKEILIALAIGITAVLVPAMAAYIAHAVVAAAATIAATWPILLIIGLIALLVFGLIKAWQKWGWFRNGVMAAAAGLMIFFGWIAAVIGFLGSLISKLGEVIAAFAELSEAIPGGPGSPGSVGTLVKGASKPGAGSLFGGAIRGLAHGGIASGLRAVGERGMELVDLPAGTRVHPNNEVRAMLANAGGGSTLVVNVHVAGSILSERDLVKVVRDEALRGGFRGVLT